MPSRILRNGISILENGNSIRLTNTWRGFFLPDEFQPTVTTENSILSFEVKFGDGEQQPEFVFLALHNNLRLHNSGPIIAMLHVGNDIENPTGVSLKETLSFFSSPTVQSDESWYESREDGWFRYSIPIGVIRNDKSFDRIVIGVTDRGLNPVDGRDGWAEFRSIRVYDHPGDGSFAQVDVKEDLSVSGDVFLQGGIRDSITGELIFELRNEKINLKGELTLGSAQGDISMGIFGTTNSED